MPLADYATCMRAILVVGVVVFLLVGCGGSRQLSTGLTSKSAGANIGQVQSIVVDPANPRVVFAFLVYDSGLESTDGGAHWHHVSFPVRSSPPRLLHP